MDRVVVVDYGMGNLRSVERALQHVATNAQVSISSDPDVVRKADRVVFPGQGAMPDCMRYLRGNGAGRGGAGGRSRQTVLWRLCRHANVAG